VCDETIIVYATHQFHLTNDRLCSDHSVTALGLDVSLDFIIYRRDKYDAVCQIEIPTDASFRKGLEVLGLIVNEPDFLGLHILPVKHALVGLLSHWRHVNQSKWDEPMPIPLLDLIRDWVDLVKSTPLPKVPRRIDMGAPFDVFTDSSRSLMCYQIYQYDCDVPIMCEQFTISASESHFHINVLELSAVWRSLNRLQLVCIDSGLSANSLITVHLDSQTALSILLNRRVPRGPHQALYQKFLDLIQVASANFHIRYVYVMSKLNPADAGTRSELLYEVHRVRSDLVDKLLPAEDPKTVMPVRPRSDSSDQQGDQSPLVRRSARLAKKRRVDDAEPVPSQEEPTDEPPIVVDSGYDFRPVYTSVPGLPPPSYSTTLLGDIDGDVDTITIEDPTDQLELASYGHEIAHEANEVVYDRLRRFYTWPNMKKTIAKAAELCEPCGRTKTRPCDRQFKQAVRAPRLTPIPFHKVGMDGLGPFGTMHILTLTDYYSCYCLTRTTTTAPTAYDVRQLLNKVYRLFGVFPRIVRSDNASIFRSASTTFPGVWTFSPVHGSPSNGHAERRHRVINQKLRRLLLQGVVGNDLSGWNDILTKICGEMNNAPVCRAGGLCPTDILMYYPCTNIITGANRQQVANKHAVWRNYRTAALARTAQKIAVAEQSLAIGQHVMVRVQKPNSKLSPRYDPATITRILGSNRVELDNGSIVHSRDLKILRSLVPDEDSDDDDDDDVSETTANT
ncbi:hypothetical protein FOZ61_007124, partial [Perkinsus olseni]